jgi:hypothetical protein
LSTNIKHCFVTSESALFFFKKRTKTTISIIPETTPKKQLIQYFSNKTHCHASTMPAKQGNANPEKKKSYSFSNYQNQSLSFTQNSAKPTQGVWGLAPKKKHRK